MNEPAGPLRRLAGISASLVATNVATSVLGLAFWTEAARTLDASAVGVAGAAMAMTMLVGSFGSLGLGTLLISRLPEEAQGTRRRLVRSALTLAGAVAAALSLLVVWPAIGMFGTDNLRPVVATPAEAVLFGTGTALTAVTMVLDQAVLVLGIGSLQLERNLVASGAKIVALLVLVGAGAHSGSAVVLAWAVGNVVSLLAVVYRTRTGRRLEDPGPLIDLRVLRGMGHEAISHHALNLGLQMPLQLLPVLVTVILSARANGYFSTAMLVSGFVFTLPYAISVGLFAAAEGDEREVLRRLRLTIPFALGVSLVANAVLYPSAGIVLGVFGKGYADGSTDVLRILLLAGLAFVIKDHFVALRRVQRRTTQAAVVVAVLSVLELVAAAVGAQLGGLVGLSASWVGAVTLEALVFVVPLIRGAKTLDGLVPSVAPPTIPLNVTSENLLEASGPIPMLLDSHADLRALDTPPGRIPMLLDSHADLRALDTPCRIPGPSGGLLRSSVPRHALLAGMPRHALLAGMPRHALLPVAQRPHRDLLGPTLALMSAGLVVMAVAAALARTRTEEPSLSALYALGLVTVFLPATIRITYSGTGRRELFVLGLALPTLLELSRSILYPTHFAYHDELIHQNTLRQIADTHHLFIPNPLLPVSSYYPGIEIVTDCLHNLTGLSPFASATVLLLLVRIVLTAAFMALIAMLTGSLRIAAIASALYTCNPQMIFFNSQFSYQSMALPLAVLTIYLLSSRDHRGVTSTLGSVATLIAVAATHHLTCMLLVGALAAWTVLEFTFGRRRHVRGQAHVLAALTGIGVLAVGAAAMNPGNPIGGYLTAIVQSSTQALESFASGDSTKTTFVDPAGQSSMLWEQNLMVFAVAVVALALLPALVLARSWWRRRVPLAMGLILLSMLDPIIPAGHLTRATAEVGDRAAGFVFLGVAFVLAWSLHDKAITGRWSAVAGAAAAAVFLGNVILGAGPIGSQLPGPYEVSADARSIDADNLAAARWAGEGLPPHSRLYADRVSGLLMAAIGGHVTVRHISTGVDASRLLLDPRFTAKDLAVARSANLDYVVVDERDAQSLPHRAVYIENGEFGESHRTEPVPVEALRKLARAPGVDRIFDNGSVVVYDIERMRLVP